MDKTADQLVSDATAALKQGNRRLALELLEKAAQLDDRPEILSNLALCIASERNDSRQALELCRRALAEEPWNSLHYLNLGKIHLLEGRKKDAIRVFRDGLLHQANPLIKEELQRLGTRRYPVIASLPREHKLNIFLGKLFAKLRLR